MNFKRSTIPDVVICEPEFFGDKRGYFSETFRQDKLNEFLGFEVKFCQDNESKSSFGVLRGLHYQLNPFAQTKLVRVISGTVLDVVVDIRKNSLTFGKHFSIELSSENKKQLFVPKGFAHGFVVLSKSAVFSYKVDNFYNRDFDRGISFNDPFLGIDWILPYEKLVLSKKDINHPLFNEAEHFLNSKGFYE